MTNMLLEIVRIDIPQETSRCERRYIYF